MPNFEGSLSSLVILQSAFLLIACPLAPTGNARAQELGGLWYSVSTNAESLAGVPVMVSCIRDGEIVFQQEVLPNVTGKSGGRCLSPGEPELTAAGVYDVRFEGSGMKTEVKQGVQVLADRNTYLKAVMLPGSGIHVVEYSIGGLAREEVARRLRHLEAEVDAIREDIDELKSSLGELSAE